MSEQRPLHRLRERDRHDFQAAGTAAFAGEFDGPVTRPRFDPGVAAPLIDPPVVLVPPARCDVAAVGAGEP